MDTAKKIIISCPTCKKEVIWNERPKSRPFCCERCKLIDLGEWFAEEKKIPGEPISSESELNYDSFYNTNRH